MTIIVMTEIICNECKKSGGDCVMSRAADQLTEVSTAEVIQQAIRHGFELKGHGIHQKHYCRSCAKKLKEAGKI